MQARSTPGETGYSTYLRLPELLTLQSSRSEPENPYELHFIVTHQAIELWFKALIWDVRRARDLIEHDELMTGTALIRRAIAMVRATEAQLGTLELMPPEAFHQFRPYLGTASGVESVQFRELEILSGLRSSAFVSRLHAHYGGELPNSLALALLERSLADVHQDAGSRHGVVDWSLLYADPHLDRPLYELTSALLDYDDAWRRWRSEHIALVLRMLGGAVFGTGGTDSSYLSRRIYTRFFPYLWNARSKSTVEAGGRLVDETVDAGAPMAYRGGGQCGSEQ